MKTIAIAVHLLTVEYTLSILNGICDYFKDKDIRFIITQIKDPTHTKSIYEYQSFSSLSSILNEQIDGLIILSGYFNTSNALPILQDTINSFKNKPIVSVSVPLNIPDCSTIILDDTNAYNTLITHLHKNHKIKKFAFIGPDPKTSLEGKTRFNCFLNALKNNNLTFYENNYFFGSFTGKLSQTDLELRLLKKEDIDFECLVAANDLLAITSAKYFTKIGLSIPKDLKIIGYDNTSHAKQFSPSITTIDQNFYIQGQKAGELILNKIEGKQTPSIIKVSSTPIIYNSCGCKQKKSKNDVDENSQLLSNGVQSHFLSKLLKLTSIFDMTKASDTTKMLFESLNNMIDQSGIREIAVCYYDKPEVITRHNFLIKASKINLNMHIDLDKNISDFSTNTFFDPSKEIIPSSILENSPGTFIFHPIYSGDINYGYVLCRLEGNDYAVYSVAIRIIISTLAQAFEYSNKITENTLLSKENKELLHNNTNLKNQSKTDELTHLLNRRGFMELGQEHIDMSIEDDTSGLVFFSDLDGLKVINDTYGHQVGDQAIKAAGQVLSQVLRANDVVAHLSGDEFAGVASGMRPNQIGRIRNDIEKCCKEISIKEKFPFTLSMSIGFAKFYKKNSCLKDLLDQADKMLYEEKKIKHKKN